MNSPKSSGNSELAKRAFGSNDLQTLTASMLTDKKVLRRLYARVSDTASRYDMAIQMFSFLPSNNLCVLLDFDVIHSYITPEKDRLDDRESMEQAAHIAHFFERATVPYQLAHGAVRDLRRFLVRYSPFVNLSTEEECDSLLQQIMDITKKSVKEVDVVNEYEEWKAAVEASKRSDCVEDRVLVRRLHTVLFGSPATLSRFRGVVGGYNDALAVRFARSLDDLFQTEKKRTRQRLGRSSDIESHRHKFRAVERNDGINLATACRLNSDAKSSNDESEPHYVVLTKREDVYNISCDYIDDPRNDCDYRFAMLPSQMYWLDITGFVNWGDAVCESAEVCKESLNDLAKSLRVQMRNVNYGGAEWLPVSLRNAMTRWSSEVNAFTLLDIEQSVSESRFIPSGDKDSLESESFFKLLLNIRSIAISAPIRAFVSRASMDNGRASYAICDDSPGRTGWLCDLIVGDSGRWTVLFSVHGNFFSFVRAYAMLMSECDSPAVADPVDVVCCGPEGHFEGNGIRVTTSYGVLWYVVSGSVSTIPSRIDSLSKLAAEATQLLTRGRDTVSAATEERREIVPRVLSIAVISDPYEVEFSLQPSDGENRKFCVLRGRGKLLGKVAAFVHLLGATLLPEETLQDMLACRVNGNPKPRGDLHD